MDASPPTLFLLEMRTNLLMNCTLKPKHLICLKPSIRDLKIYHIIIRNDIYRVGDRGYARELTTYVLYL